MATKKVTVSIYQPAVRIEVYRLAAKLAVFNSWDRPASRLLLFRPAQGSQISPRSWENDNFRT